VVQEIEERLSSVSEDGELISALPHEEGRVVSDLVDDVSNVKLERGQVGSGEESLLSIDGEDDLEALSESSVHEGNVIGSQVGGSEHGGVLSHSHLGDRVGVVDSNGIDSKSLHCGEISVPKGLEPGA